MGMQILDHDEDLTHIVFSGRLDTTIVEQIEKSYFEATAQRGQPAIVDLSGIEFIASRGIGMLVASGKRLQKQGQQMILLNPQGMVDTVLKSSKVDKLMPIAYQLEEAMRILGRDPGKMAGSSPQHAAAIDDSGPPQAAVAAAAAEQTLALSIKNELSELQVLTQALHQFLNVHSVPSRAAYAADLAIEELVVNVIRYAYVDADEHLIDVELTIEGDQLVLQIVDDGRPFDPRESPAFNPHAEDYEAGGLGLILVLDLVDTLKYERVENKNRVEVRVHMAAMPEIGEQPMATEQGPAESGAPG